MAELTRERLGALRAVAVGCGGAPHEPHPHLSGRGEVQGAQRKVQRTAFFAFLKL